MSKVKFSALVSDMRGKLNGSVFSKNRGGSYLRNKVTPINPATSAQGQARSVLTEFSQAWRSLTEAQRTAWNNAVANFARTDIFGDLKNPSGINLFTRLNANIRNGGSAVSISSPPVPAAVPAITLGAMVNSAAGALSIVFADSPVPAGHALVIEATPQVSAGVSFVKSEFRKLKVVAAAGASPAVLTADYLARFGARVAGQKIFVRVTLVSLTTGLQSGSVTHSALVV